MSRLTNFVVAVVGLGVATSVVGCQIEASIKTKTRYTTNVAKEGVDWGGEPIVIKIEGVGVSVNGGVSVTADPSATQVTASARLLAMAFSEEKSNADLSIEEVKNTFVIAKDSGGITVSCGHGGSHGSSSSGESGCEKVDVVIPAGDASKPLDLKVLSGSGELTLQLASATLKNLGTNAHGLTNADVPATQGAGISLVDEDGNDITVKLPADFAADEIILQADEDKIHLGPFTDVKSGEGRGQPGTGLASLKLTSKEFAGSTGEITLR